MTKEKMKEYEETRQYAKSLLRSGKSTAYIMEITGLSEGVLSKLRGELGLGIRGKEVDLSGKLDKIPVNFAEDWARYAGAIRDAYRTGSIKKMIILVPAEKSRK